jgi:DHA2 family multidrug resistance protein
LLPLVGYLVSRVDARFLIATGFVITSMALFHMTHWTLGIDYRTAVLARVFQALGIAFLFVPINTISYADMPPQASNQVSAMINLMRNLGGSIGISVVTTLLARRTQLHQVYLVHNIQTGNYRFENTLASLTTRLSPHLGEVEARRQAYGRIYAELGRQATMLAYIDTFHIMAVLCLAATGLLLFAKRNRPGAAPVAH